MPADLNIENEVLIKTISFSFTNLINLFSYFFILTMRIYLISAISAVWIACSLATPVIRRISEHPRVKKHHSSDPNRKPGQPHPASALSPQNRVPWVTR
jgi:hypothetical protein